MWWLIPIFLIVAFFSVLIIRALLFTPKKQIEASNEEISFDKEKAANCLKELVTCKTISYFDSSLEDDAEFKKLVDKLPKLYPNFFKHIESFEIVICSPTDNITSSSLLSKFSLRFKS